jgi:hypothetical protein
MPTAQIVSGVMVMLACAACSDASENRAESREAPTETVPAARESAPAMHLAGAPAAVPEMTTTAAASGGEKTADISDWRTLVEGAWQLAGGEEGYRCARLTATEDLYIKEFQPIAPLGTHHTLLSVNEEPTAPDGIAKCGANDNGHVTLLGSGVGENYSSGPLPEGVAYKIPKGSQLNLNLHLFNVRDKVLEGTSGVKIRTTSADKVKELAQVTLAGSVSLSIPTGMSTSKGKCTLANAATVFAVSPHMHQLGTHLKATAKRAAGAPVTLYDGPYDFNEQRQYPAEMLKLAAGDTVEVECTYANTTDRTVAFGESSLDEMCFIGLYKFPLTDDGLVCVR